MTQPNWDDAMSVQACANLVAQEDPVRFKAAMAAPVKCRAVLLAVYAANVEISRAAWVTNEPLIAEMRLQWWRDVLAQFAKGRPQKHMVVDALAHVFDHAPIDHMLSAIDARAWDISRAPHESIEALLSYCTATVAGPMITNYLALGGHDDQVPALHRLAAPVGLARFVNAIPRFRTHMSGDIFAAPLVNGLHDELGRQYVQLCENACRFFAQKSAANAALIEIAGTGRILRRLQKQKDLSNPAPVGTPLAMALERAWLSRAVI